MKVVIKNCNNIDHGEIEIKENYLNIKYAFNGTGKSTIAYAIEGFVNDQLDDLIPFKYYKEKAENKYKDEHRPVVEIYPNMKSTIKFTKENSPLKKVRIFNENYVDTHTFIRDEVVTNSFEIYVKTPNYDDNSKKIDSLVSEIKDFVNKNTELKDIIILFESFLKKVKPGKRTPYSTTGQFFKALGEGNRTTNIPENLLGYETFILGENSGRWAGWQSEGKVFFNRDADYAPCPYCSKNVEPEIKSAIESVSETYSSSYLNDLKAVLEAFKEIKGFFTDSVNEKIDKLGANPDGFSKNEIDLIDMLCDRINRLKSRFESTMSIGFNSLKSIDDIIVHLSENIIDLDIYSELKSQKTEALVEELNGALKSTVNSASALKTAIDVQNELIRETIKKNKDGIDTFLLKAGYDYTVEIEEETKTQNYKMLLKYNSGKVLVPEIKKHLSYGERNAFALALFLYDVAKEKPDLVILDDPISSFDKHKKFAIMDMLFCGDDISLRGITTLMLTHDFEPVSDAIRTQKTSFNWKDEEDFSGQFVKAAFLYISLSEANECKLLEKQICEQNITNYQKILMTNITKANNLVSKLIYLRRYKELQGDKNEVWDSLSSFFHKDTPVPVKRNGNGKEYIEISEEIITRVESEISKNIKEPFSYKLEYPLFWNSRTIIEYYKNANNYEKLQLFRCLVKQLDKDILEITNAVFAKFINETYHSEMEYILQLNPLEFETVPNYIICRCNEEVEKFEKELNCDKENP